MTGGEAGARRLACVAPRTVPQAGPPRTSRRVPALPRRPPGLLPSLQRSPRSRSPIDQPLPLPGRRLLSSASLAAKALRSRVGPGAERGLRAPGERKPPLDRRQRRIPAADLCLPSGTADLSRSVRVALGPEGPEQPLNLDGREPSAASPKSELQDGSPDAQRARAAVKALPLGGFQLLQSWIMGDPPALAA
ncbi:hypothetical protein LEMLEM_LOCUS23761 [Lemmus lemmus]